MDTKKIPEKTISAVRKKIKGDPNRYVIQNIETGEILDDAQGYGYKSAQKAHAAYNYKHNGGKKKVDAAKAYWRKHRDIEKFCENIMMSCFKEFARGEYNLTDLQEEIKDEFDIEVPTHLLKRL